MDSGLDAPNDPPKIKSGRATKLGRFFLKVRRTGFQPVQKQNKVCRDKKTKRQKDRLKTCPTFHHLFATRDLVSGREIFGNWDGHFAAGGPFAAALQAGDKTDAIL